MVTSAGASVFKNNLVNDDATVIKNLKKNNVLILGKLNMSEWAYYFCRPCPVGYSSLGGQTLNPCLLYTSPSPRDMRRSRMPSSA